MGAKSHERDLTIDFMRGFALLVMTVDHLPPNPLQRFTFQPFGFFTGAFIFVFLSGYVSAWRVASRVDSKGWLAARRTVVRRVVLLMGLHHLIATLVAITAHFVPPTDESLTVFAAYYPSPLKAWALEMMFLNQTVFLDILTLFILLLPSILALVWLFRRGGTRVALAASALLWLSVQFDVAPGLLRRFDRFTVLHLSAWQFLFVFGAWVGYRRYRGIEFQFTKDIAVRWAALSFVTGCFVVRQTGLVPVGTPLVVPDLVGFDVADLGCFRLIDFAAVVALCGMLADRWWKAIPRISPLTVIVGRHSLSVFVCHLGVVYWIWYACAGAPAEHLTIVSRLGIPLFAVAVIAMFAWQLDRHRRPAGLPGSSPAPEACGLAVSPLTVEARVGQPGI
jgi:hypothetical protein